MAFHRIIGQEDKVYRRFADYCISEANNECFLLCCVCHEEHQNEEALWTHIRDAHNYTLAPLKSATASQTDDDTADSTSQGNKTNEPPLTSEKEEKPNCSHQQPPKLITAETLANTLLNDPSNLLGLDEETARFFRGDDTSTEPHAVPQPRNKEYINERAANPRYILVRKTASRKLLHPKILKALLQQMQEEAIECQFKLNKVAQQVVVIQNDLKVKPNVRYMKVLPEEPYKTREEVLLLENELQNSLEMRDCLYNEALRLVVDTPDLYCRSLWRLIMTDEICTQFCWRGVVDGERIIKHPLKNMSLTTVFRDAFHSKFPVKPLDFFKIRSIVFFNKAQIRLNRVEERNAKLLDQEDEVMEAFKVENHEEFLRDHLKALEDKEAEAMENQYFT